VDESTSNEPAGLILVRLESWVAAVVFCSSAAAHLFDHGLIHCRVDGCRCILLQQGKYLVLQYIGQWQGVGLLSSSLSVFLWICPETPYYLVFPAVLVQFLCTMVPGTLRVLVLNLRRSLRSRSEYPTGLQYTLLSKTSQQHSSISLTGTRFVKNLNYIKKTKKSSRRDRSLPI
jgi:hypothetical protein